MTVDNGSLTFKVKGVTRFFILVLKVSLDFIQDTDNKRYLITKIYTEIDCNVPYDIVVYTISEWEKFKNDKDTFVYSIIKNWVKIYGWYIKI